MKVAMYCFPLGHSPESPKKPGKKGPWQKPYRVTCRRVCHGFHKWPQTDGDETECGFGSIGGGAGSG